MSKLEHEAEEHNVVTLKTYSRFRIQSHLPVPGEVLAILATEADMQDVVPANLWKRFS